MDNNITDRMEKVPYRNLPSKLSLLWLACMLAFSVTQISFASTTVLPTQAVDTAKGETLFKANCAACHNLYKKMTGPALFGVGDKYEKQWLYSWIKNSQEMVKSGDAQAVKIFEEYNGSVMTAFPQLSDADIDDIIAYTYKEKKVAPPPTVDPATAGTGGGMSNDIILAVLALVFLLLVVMLILVNKTLRRIAEANGVEYEEKEDDNCMCVEDFVAINCPECF